MSTAPLGPYSLGQGVDLWVIQFEHTDNIVRPLVET